MININSPIATVLKDRKEWLEREVVQFEKAISDRMKYVQQFTEEIEKCKQEIEEIQQFFDENVYITPVQALGEEKKDEN